MATLTTNLKFDVTNLSAASWSLYFRYRAASLNSSSGVKRGTWLISLRYDSRDRRPLYFSIAKTLLISFLPSRPSEVYHLTRSHQLPILQNDRVNNLPTDQTFLSPELFIETVKFVIDHGAPAAKTLDN